MWLVCWVVVVEDLLVLRVREQLLLVCRAGCRSQVNLYVNGRAGREQVEAMSALPLSARKRESSRRETFKPARLDFRHLRPLPRSPALQADLKIPQPLFLFLSPPTLSLEKSQRSSHTDGTSSTLSSPYTALGKVPGHLALAASTQKCAGIKAHIPADPPSRPPFSRRTSHRRSHSFLEA